MILYGLRIEEGKYNSSIKFRIGDGQYEIVFASRSHRSGEEQVSVPPATKLLDYIDHLIRTKADVQVKYAELLSKYSEVVEKLVIIQRERIDNASTHKQGTQEEQGCDKAV